MYSLFKSPTLTDRRNIIQENNLIARKPGQQSTRKPFGERPVNVKNETPSLVKPKLIPKVIEPEDTFPEDSSIYTCSYKDPQETYNDLRNERDFLGKKGMKNIIRLFLDEIENLPEVDNHAEPQIIDDKPAYNTFEADKISDLFKCDFKLPQDVAMPFLEDDF